MAAKIVSIADDVVTVINGGTFSIGAVSASRLYIPDFDLSDLKTLKVSVLPASSPEEITARTTSQIDYVISIGVQKKTTNLTTDFDALVEFVEEMNELFRFTRLPVTNSAWIASEIDPVFDHDHGTQLSVFTSVLSLTFRDFLKK